MNRADRRRRGLSLLELLIVISLLGILAALAVPSLTPDTAEQLGSAAQVLAHDLDYGRSLAVANNSKYRFRFDLAANSYRLEHSGSNPSLNSLPQGPLYNPSEAAEHQTVKLDEMPTLGSRVRLAAVRAGSSNVTVLEFGPLGSTSQTRETIVWLQGGGGTHLRYLPVRVNPVTGLTTVGTIQATAP